MAASAAEPPRDPTGIGAFILLSLAAGCLFRVLMKRGKLLSSDASCCVTAISRGTPSASTGLRLGLGCGLFSSCKRPSWLPQLSALPYTVNLLLFGLALGYLDKKVGTGGLGYLSHSIQSWRNLDPHVVLYMFLPPLIYESASSIDFHVPAVILQTTFLD